MSCLGRFSFYLVILLYLIYVHLYSVHAAVVLNEVEIQPNQVVELYNNASTSADISSWYIDDSGGATYYTIPPNTIIPALSCFIFTSDFSFNKTTADSVRLFDNTGPPTTTSAKLIEQYLYAKAPDAGYSFSKKKDGGTEWQITNSSLGLFNESLTSCIPTSTPTPFPTETPIPTPTITSMPTQEPTQTPTPLLKIDYQNIYISEVYPYPLSNEHEWIELYNDNDIQVELSHWYIDDIENGGSAPKSFSLIMNPSSYASIDFPSSLFNNDGDTVRLLNENKTEKDSMEYKKITQGKSIGRISFEKDSYCEQEPSKNSANSLCIETTESQTTSQYHLSTQYTNTISQKITSPTKKPTNQLQTNTHPTTGSTQKNSTIQKGEVLSAQVENSSNISPTPYLSSISFSYSLLTIVSIFIKMRNA